MKIMITDIKNLDENRVVYFRCSLGNGLATWMNSEAPSKNYQYDVEIDVDKAIDEVPFSKTDNEREYWLKLEDSAVSMNGIIESIEDDGMAYYRLSPDCIIMIDSGESNVEEGDWIKLRLEYLDVEITAQGV